MIDYFVNNFVFPRHAKQFQLKLQTSGWDLPLITISHQNGVEALPEYSSVGTPLTTGFSGTNGWKRMLPLTIRQQDLPGLAHTNAEVLTYLLQPRNRRYVLAVDSKCRQLSEIELLKKITGMHIRVLIDAGAMIMEMSNHAVAKAWLSMNTGPPAIVYFEENKPYVLHRNNSRVPLLVSAYADDLGKCLVYLDDAHTRGTDLKIPAKARGILTLGLGQAKDNTVQGMDLVPRIYHPLHFR
jgi:hypothetical protein